jgi:hypothetical protein
MKTEVLIRALVADSVSPVTPLGHHLLRGVLSGAMVAVILFSVMLHARADLSLAFRSPAFVYKLIAAASLAVTAGSLLSETARPLPTSSRRRRGLLIVAPALLAIGVGVELCMQPAGLWLSRLVGHNAGHCLSLIPFLAAGPAVCLFIALRRGAPARPASAGAIVGLASGGIGAVLYALTCPDDSPLFVATWYTIAITTVTGVTAFAGRRLLRW